MTTSLPNELEKAYGGCDVVDTVGTDLQIHVWADRGMDCIKMRISRELTSVNNDPGSKRGNPSLYKKLARALRDAGKAYPHGIL